MYPELQGDRSFVICKMMTATHTAKYPPTTKEACRILCSLQKKVLGISIYIGGVSTYAQHMPSISASSLRPCKQAGFRLEMGSHGGNHIDKLLPKFIVKILHELERICVFLLTMNICENKINELRLPKEGEKGAREEISCSSQLMIKDLDKLISYLHTYCDWKTVNPKQTSPSLSPAIFSSLTYISHFLFFLGSANACECDHTKKHH